MSDFLQVIPDSGYVIHAVPADRTRTGLFGVYIYGPPLCGRIKGRINGFSNLRLQFADWANDKETAKPFSRNPEDFNINLAGRRICEHCAEVITEREEAA